MEEDGWDLFATLLINYLDFETALNWLTLELEDSRSIWISIISCQLLEILVHANKQNCVWHERQQSEWFYVKTGVRRVCDFTGSLVIDWVMEKVTEQPWGLVWGLTARLKDNDFADDLVLLSHSQKCMQDETESARWHGQDQGDESEKQNSCTKKWPEPKLKYRPSYILAVISNFLSWQWHQTRTELAAQIIAAQSFNGLQNIWQSPVLQTKRQSRSTSPFSFLYISETGRRNQKINNWLRRF